MIININNNNYPDRISFNQIKLLSESVINGTISDDDLKMIDYIMTKCNEIITSKTNQSTIPLLKIQNKDGTFLFDSSLTQSNCTTIIGYLAGTSGYLGYHWEKVSCFDNDGLPYKKGCFVKDDNNIKLERINKKKMAIENKNETIPETTEKKRSSKRKTEELTLSDEELFEKFMSFYNMIKESEKENIDNTQLISKKIIHHDPDEQVGVRQTYLFNSTDLRLQEFIDENSCFRAVNLIDVIINAGLDALNASKVEYNSLEELSEKYNKMKNERSKRKEK